MYKLDKRVLDIVFALLIGIVFLPVGLIIAILICLTSKGPALFRQERVGKDCKLFTIYKFRTMRIETEKDGQALGDMQRMTKLGNVLRKLSLDEMPQLLNIIKGEMSFIGPRPLLVEYLPLYNEFQMRRHEVKPGMTGWAQVNGRNHVTWEQRFSNDIWYVEHMSFKVDLIILFKTIQYVLSGRGVEAETLTIFSGNKKADDV